MAESNPTEPANNGAGHLTANSAIVAGGTLLFVWLLWRNRRIGKRIKDCSRYTSNILAGNMPADLHTGGGGEIGRLAESMKKLGEQFYAEKEELRSLARRLVTVQESDRFAIARELHDEVGQHLTLCKILVEKASRTAPTGGRETFKEIEACLSDIMAKVRNISLVLRPRVLDEEGIRPALKWHIDQYQSHSRVQVDFQAPDSLPPLSPEANLAAYRIVQEALTNVARHAGVKEARVRAWTEPDTLVLRIEDNGAGFDPGYLPAGSSGISGMRDRALILGGSLTVESAPGAGTTITARLPIA